MSNVTLSFAIKHSDNWDWTGVPYHPHEFHFITTEDDPFVGPAATHLTTYIEVVNGVPHLAIQDGRNIDESRVGENLVGVTENRAVAGCNGNADGTTDDDCYRAGTRHANGKAWAADGVYFGDKRGDRYKGDWHRVKARFKLNSVVDGIGVADGELQYWFDGKLLIDQRNVVLRTGARPNMKFNQFLMTPYFGPGVRHEQRIWVDDLRIHTEK
ncbi:MAG: hypothetical protein O3A46_00435 [Candidatus Poribacteria bacterium]|nr:hypothetical protein [Candidatus Poribacteria bacterium]